MLPPYGLPAGASTRNSVTNERRHGSRERVAHRERAGRGIRRVVPGATPCRKVLLLVPALGAGLARPLLGRRLPELRALPVADRSVRRRSVALHPARARRGAEPGRRSGGQGSPAPEGTFQ